MFSSRFINFNGALILVGGRSGAGKTTTISCLTAKISAQFKRPQSFTTRARRIGESDEEYEFVSRAQMDALKHSGDLANYDVVAGHVYGISKRSVLDILSTGVNVIKEVHPDNFSQFRAQFKKVVTVIVDDICVKRLDEWQASPWISYAQREDIFLNRSGMAPEQAADWLVRALAVHFLAASEYPDVRLIENTNRTGYNAVAAEFTDKLRPTTAVFHKASLSAFDRTLREIATDRTVLEVAPGNGWLRSTINLAPKNFFSVDISDLMHNDLGGKHIVTAARILPFAAGFFDAIFCSLADPVLYPQSILEISRVLRVGGVFVFSCPTHYWASSVRQEREADKTTFAQMDGQQTSVYSFTRPLESLIPLFQIGSMQLRSLEFCFPSSGDDTQVPAIGAALKVRKCPASALPILYVASFARMA
jgi:guanylate kinase/SAM-dependent methyltransferase